MEFKSFLSFVTEGIGGMGSGNFFTPGAKGGVSTNTADQEKGDGPVGQTADDENDRYNASIINKNAAKLPGDNTIFVSANKPTPGGGISEGGFGDNQAAGQPVFTQHVDKSKQGYQDSSNYDDDIDDHGEDCDCPECQNGSTDLVTRGS